MFFILWDPILGPFDTGTYSSMKEKQFYNNDLIQFITILEKCFLEKITITAVSHGARTVHVFIKHKQD